MKQLIIAIVCFLLFCSCNKWRAKKVIDLDKKWYSERVVILKLDKGYKAGDIVEQGAHDYILLEEVNP